MVNLIISQQLSTKAANSIWKNVKGLENSKMLSLMEIFSKKNSDTLKNCGLSKNKVKAAILLRQTFEEKKIDTCKKSEQKENLNTQNMKRKEEMEQKMKITIENCV